MKLIFILLNVALVLLFLILYLSFIPIKKKKSKFYLKHLSNWIFEISYYTVYRIGKEKNDVWLINCLDHTYMKTLTEGCNLADTSILRLILAPSVILIVTSFFVNSDNEFSLVNGGTNHSLEEKLKTEKTYK